MADASRLEELISLFLLRNLENLVFFVCKIALCKFGEFTWFSSIFGDFLDDLSINLGDLLDYLSDLPGRSPDDLLDVFTLF